MSSPRPPERLVCPWMLRRLFAERQILQRVDRGEIRVARRLKTPIGPERRHAFPPSTMTRMIDYFDVSTGLKLCETHQYECIHGIVLASGLPDPKTFWELTATLVADSGHPERRGYTCSDDCAEDRRRTELARQGDLASYRRECARCGAWRPSRSR